MTKYLLPALFCLCTEITNAQQRIEVENPANYEISTWGTDSLDRGMFLIKQPKGFLFIGVTYNHHGQLMLAGIDNRATVQWKKIYPTPKFQFAFAGAGGETGTAILSGYATGARSDLDIFVCSVNAGNGDTLWTKKIGGPNGDRAYKTIRTRDGDFVTIGQTESWGEGGIDSYVFKFNASGDIRWQKTFGTPVLERTYSAVELNNGDLIVSGIANGNYPDNSDIFVLKLSSNGDLLWKRIVGSAKGDIAHSLHKLTDNTFFTVGYTAEQSDSISDPLIMHMNANGEVLGKYITQTGEEVRLINGYVQDDVFIGTGFTRKHSRDNWDLALVKFDFKTSRFTLKRIEYSNEEEQGFHAQRIDNDTALIIGHTLKGNGDVLMVKWSHQ